jgi:two-component system, chemotaxis family, protein-glutamate methylesterase/glutaminase
MSDIRVAVADDSAFVRKAIARMLADEPGMSLVGSAGSGEELLDRLDQWGPDAIILDLSMPGIGGLSTLDRIMARRPMPVIILSTHTKSGAPQTIEALHRGATDFIDKQRYSLVDFDRLRAALVEKIRGATGAAAPAGGPESTTPAAACALPSPRPGAAAPSLVLLGASTGGPPAVEAILRGLGERLPVPVLVVQHMPSGFTRAFAGRLDAQLPLAVKEAAHGEELLAGTVYIAPGGIHLRVARDGGRLRAALSPHPEDAAHRPSVDVLFASAGVAVGARAVAALLTGMGQDGASGLCVLARAGCHTIAQDEASCVVYGMPRAAVEAGAVRETLPLARIGLRLRELVLDNPEKEPPCSPRKSW